MTDIDLSVALVTRNRPESLGRTLQSLRAQRVQPFEVVVSDDSDPKYVDEVQRVAERYDCRYVEGPKKGLYPNRNRAAQACRGTHIRTMDDDHEFPEGHIEACLEAIRSDPEAVWVIGEKNYSTGLDSAAIAGPGEIHPRGHTVIPEDDQHSKAIADGSAIFPNKVFSEEGGYREKPWAGYLYLELGSRLKSRGLRIREVKDTHVLHKDENKRGVGGNNNVRGVDSIEKRSLYYTIVMDSFVYHPSISSMVNCLGRIVVDTIKRPRRLFDARKAITEVCNDIQITKN
ncbi:glycosyltransferase family 2 protein [Salinibacter ruber]|uniref:glycosyltransferase family 2 protein n=1 Tax=Salinibacter ruber TaxID=146919 RepID=UPI0016173798|nr:glycosyltransferase [Salinibacter ruber]